MPLLPPSERWPAWVNRLLLTARQDLQPDPRRSTGRAAEQGPRRAAARRTADRPTHRASTADPQPEPEPEPEPSQNLNLSQNRART